MNNQKDKKEKPVKHDKHTGHARCLFCNITTWRCNLCLAVHLRECNKVEYEKDESQADK